MNKPILDAFIMPVDGQEHSSSDATESLLVAIGSDGEFYAHQRRISSNFEALSKAVEFAGRVVAAKAINLRLWSKLPKEWVKTSYPYRDFGCA